MTGVQRVADAIEVRGFVWATGRRYIGRACAGRRGSHPGGRFRVCGRRAGCPEGEEGVGSAGPSEPAGQRRTTRVTRGIARFGFLDPRGWGTLRLIFVITLGMGVFTIVVAVTLIGVRRDAESRPGNRWGVIEVDPEAPYLPTLANATLGAGANRLSFTIQDARGQIRGDLDVRVGIYDIAIDPDVAVSEQFAQFISYEAETPLPASHRHAGASPSDQARYVGAGVYVVPAFFPRPGTWGLEFAIQPSDGSGAEAPVLFRMAVRERGEAPAPGDAAVSVRSRTLADEPDLGRLTSDPRPEPGLYQVSIDEALAKARPLVLIFATPAFCHSRTCGPSVDVVKAVWRAQAGAIDAIHVEVFANPEEPESLREAAAFRAWDLPSEPWIFVVDGAGTIFSAYEGTVTERELGGDVETLLGE